MAHGNVNIINSIDHWEIKLVEALSANKVVVVDFTASWCGPCKFIAPFFAELSEKYHNLVFLKVDVDELPDVSSQYEVRAMPTFVFIENGVAVERIVGANVAELENKVKHFDEKSASQTE